MIAWDIYEISSDAHPLTSVKMRGRLRKFSLSKHMHMLVENTEEIEGRVRFAVETKQDIREIKKFLEKLIPDVKIEKKLENIKNPVLSKLKINEEERYEI